MILHKILLIRSIDCTLWVRGWVILLLVIGAVRYTVKVRFIDYLNESQNQSLLQLSQRFEQKYAPTSENWAKLIQNPRVFEREVVQQFNESSLDFHPSRADDASPVVQDTMRDSWRDDHPFARPHFMPMDRRERPPQRLPIAIKLIDKNGTYIYGFPRNDVKQYEVPIYDAHHQLLATLAVGELTKASNPKEQAYLNALMQSLWWIAGISLLIAILPANILASFILKPIKALNRAADALGERVFDTRIATAQQDEIGQLSDAMNSMASKLEQHEQKQREWLGYISHDLRTPITVLKVEIEALIDGLCPVTPSALLSLQQEVDDVSQLLDQFHQFAVSNMKPHTQRSLINPIDSLLDTIGRAETLLQHAQLSCTVIQPPLPVMVYATKTELVQIWQNLLQNSIRYTDSAGQIVIECEKSDKQLCVRWLDSAPSVPEEMLEMLDKPLFRVESSRNKQFSGSGLGLSIVKNMVAGLGGKLFFETAELGGLCVIIMLPLSE
jgi:two-component system sensor histidine kinase BaeS